MKKTFSLLLIFVYLLSFAQSSSDLNNTKVICKYYVEFLKDTLNIESKTSEVMVLQIGNNTSLYKSQQKRATDSLRALSFQKSIEAAKTSGSMVVDFSKIPKVNLVHEVYKNDREFEIFDKISKDQFVYTVTEKIKWKIGQSKKRIGDYECTEATGVYNGRIYTAWFTTKVPIAEGPYLFKELPGLVLEVYDSEKYFFITLISIQNVSEEILPIKGAIRTDQLSFKKKRKEMAENPVAAYQNLSNTPLTKELKDRIIQRTKKINNFLD